ncbi:MAG: cysteine hydrolase family protein [Pseudomonadota bacterium]
MDGMTFATLVIDLQQGLVQGAYQAEEVITNTNRVIAQTRQGNGLVVFVQHCHSSFVPLMKGKPGWEIHPGLERRPEDTVIEKSASDAFYQTQLLAFLNSHQVEHLWITGMQTEYCVDTTCRAALSHGFSVTLVSDAHTTGDGPMQAAKIISYHNNILTQLAHPDRRIAVQPSTDLA